MTDVQLYDPNNYASQASPGPIVGSPEPVILIAAAGYLTSGDLINGDAGDMGLLGAFSVEAWVNIPSVPASNEVIAQGPSAHPAGPTNRQWKLLITSAAKIAFLFTNGSDVTTSVTGATAMQTNAWHHVVGVYNGATLKVYLDGVQSASTAASGVPWAALGPAGSMDLRVGDTANPILFGIAEFAVYKSELSASRVAAHYQAGVQRGLVQQAASERVKAVLDLVSSHRPRNIGTAVRSIVTRYMIGQTPLDAIREAVMAEAVDACFFSTAGGTLTFLPSNHRSSSPYDTVQAIFGDAGGAELAYVDVTLDYSESYLFNEWNVTREGSSQSPGQTATASDSTSIARYFKRPQNFTGVPVVADSDSTTIAAAMLAKYKDPMTRITGITFNTIDPNVTEALFRREVMDKITVKRTPPGGGARISQDLFIQKIEVNGSNDGGPWTIKWAVSPL